MHILVERILQCTAPDIEVVVLDNGSTDDTLKRLNTIDDERLTIYANGANMGVIFNVVNVLTLGRGIYSTLLLDKDLINPFSIEKFRDFIVTHRVSCGISKYNGAPGDLDEIYFSGLAAIRKIAYTCHHPTGYFFDTQLLKKLKPNHRFIDYDYVGHFPFEFMLAELALQGSVAIYKAPLFTPENVHVQNIKKSVGTNASSEDAFFSPNGRLKMAINFSHHICSLPLAPEEKKGLILDCLFRGLIAATWGYRMVLRDQDICSHYHIGSRRVGYFEMISLAFYFIDKCTKESSQFKVEERCFSYGALFIGLFSRILYALGRRLKRAIL